jgi:peroxiredoxin
MAQLSLLALLFLDGCAAPPTRAQAASPGFVTAPSCSDGQTWQGGACVPGCPPGSQQDGGACVGGSVPGLATSQLPTPAAQAESPEVQEVADDDAGTGAVIGSPPPSFVLEPVYGSHIALAALAGKVVVVYFWATFCEPCKKSMAGLQAIQTKYASRGVAIVAVSEDEKDDVPQISRFAARYGVKFAVGWDRGHALATRWKPYALPTTYVIDKAGIVRFEHDGYRAGDEAVIEGEVASLL